MDKTIFPTLERAFPRKETLFEDWERQIVEMAGLGTAFPSTLTPGRNYHETRWGNCRRAPGRIDGASSQANKHKREFRKKEWSGQ